MHKQYTQDALNEQETQTIQASPTFSLALISIVSEIDIFGSSFKYET
jgi:hypothetical protein